MYILDKFPICLSYIHAILKPFLIYFFSELYYKVWISYAVVQKHLHFCKINIISINFSNSLV